jgi:hypothetical protein
MSLSQGHRSFVRDGESESTNQMRLDIEVESSKEPKIVLEPCSRIAGKYKARSLLKPNRLSPRFGPKFQ